MLVSTKGRYALRVMIDLAQQETAESVRLSEIAGRQGISEKYLESIVVVLSRAGLVRGTRGKGGGYRLEKAPSEYSIGEILRLTEGSLAPVACLKEQLNSCGRTGVCKALPMWESLAHVIGTFFDCITLQELVNGTIPQLELHQIAETGKKAPISDNGKM